MQCAQCSNQADIEAQDICGHCATEELFEMTAPNNETEWKLLDGLLEKIEELEDKGSPLYVSDYSAGYLGGIKAVREIIETMQIQRSQDACRVEAINDRLEKFLADPHQWDYKLRRSEAAAIIKALKEA